MLRKAGALLLVCAGMGALVGCNTSSSQYVYAAIPASDEIIAYREDTNSGVLTELAASPITAGPEVQSLVMHPSGKYLYAANAGQNNVSQFTVNSDGSLTEAQNRFPAGTAPNLVAIDSAGAYLYVANSGAADISVFSINTSNPTNGETLTAVPQNLGGLIGFVAMNIAVAPSGNFLYVTGQGVLGGQIEVFPLSSGQLGQPVLTSTGNNPFGLVINSAGTYLYTGNKADSTISEFQINSDGSLTALSGSPFSYGYLNPVSLLIDKSNTYLYAADQGSANLAAFTIGSDGGLTALSNAAAYATSSEPSFIATDARGDFLFVGNQSTSPAVESLNLDTGDGALTEVYTYKVVATPTSIVTTP
jgi:6-phosphogluconolactonase